LGIAGEVETHPVRERAGSVLAKVQGRERERAWDVP
jgi:hypothetical protein